MDTGILEEFVVIASLGSYSRAAEELNISQSSLSKHILALERELNVQLLVRNSRRVELSPAGEKLLPIAQDICSRMEDFIAAAGEESRRSRTTLTIYSIPVMAQYGIMDLIARFRREHPELTLEVEECEQQELTGRLRGAGPELVFSRRTGELQPDTDCLVYAQDYLVAVMPPEHPLAAFESLRAEQLQDVPLLLMDRLTGLHDLYAQLFEGASITPRTVYTGHRPENLLALVAQNEGIALLMKGHMDFYKPEGLVVRPLEPRIQGDICIMYRQGVRLSSGAKAFLEAACPRNSTAE